MDADSLESMSLDTAGVVGVVSLLSVKWPYMKSSICGATYVDEIGSCTSDMKKGGKLCLGHSRRHVSGERSGL